MKPGIFDNIPIEDYHADKEWFSSTGLKLARRSLRLFKMFLDGTYVIENKPQFDFGNSFELALLAHEEFDNKVAVEDEIYNQIYLSNPDVKSPRSTSMYKEWYESQKANGKYVTPAMGQDSFETIQCMLESCYQDAVIAKLIKNIEYNYSLFWIDETGLKLKTRPDICKSKKNIVVNLKTTLDGSPEQFSKDLANNDYPFQASLEIEGVIKSGFMEQVDNYFWLVCEKRPPYSATLYEFTHEDRQWCADELRYTLNTVSNAVKTNVWPSYSQRADNKYGIIEAKIPAWYKMYGL